MKILLKVTLLTSGLAAASLPILAAVDPSPDTLAKHPRLRAMLVRRQAIRQQVAKKLGLSSDQVTQLKADRLKAASAVKSIRADTNLAPEQKKTQVRDALKSARNEMLGVLTPDQKAQLRELRTRFRARQ